MREIKFRGKSLKSDKWIYGELQEDDDTSHVNGCRVDPNTVGEYTGVNDKNGNEIYEGDLIPIKCKYRTEVRFVLYDRKEEMFLLKPMANDYEEVLFLPSEEYVVVGNVHEDPEIVLREMAEQRKDRQLNLNPKKVDAFGNIHDNNELIEQ